MAFVALFGFGGFQVSNNYAWLPMMVVGVVGALMYMTQINAASRCRNCNARLSCRWDEIGQDCPRCGSKMN
jgi:hypothetical protein